MSISISRSGDTVILGVGEQLIVGNRHELKEALLDQLQRGERKFRIDFRDTRWLDSSGLGVLVSLSKKIREERGELRLVRLNEDLRTLFSLTKLDTLFQIDDDHPGGDGGAGPVVPHPPLTRGPLKGATEAEPPTDTL